MVMKKAAFFTIFFLSVFIIMETFSVILRARIYRVSEMNLASWQALCWCKWKLVTSPLRQKTNHLQSCFSLLWQRFPQLEPFDQTAELLWLYCTVGIQPGAFSSQILPRLCSFQPPSLNWWPDLLDLDVEGSPMIFSLCTCQCFHEVRYVDLHYVSSAEKP